MKYTELKVGDIIRILEKPDMWNSDICDENGRDVVTYPWEGEIEAIGGPRWKDSAKIGGYGWALNYLKFEVVKKAKPDYEIY